MEQSAQCPCPIRRLSVCLEYQRSVPPRARVSPVSYDAMDRGRSASSSTGGHNSVKPPLEDSCAVTLCNRAFRVRPVAEFQSRSVRAQSTQGRSTTSPGGAAILQTTPLNTTCSHNRCTLLERPHVLASWCHAVPCMHELGTVSSNSKICDSRALRMNAERIIVSNCHCSLDYYKFNNATRLRVELL